MDPVKRRLVYVADEHEVLLNELSGTPPTRQSRMTRLLVPPSPPLSSQRTSGTLSPAPRPVVPQARTSTAVDTQLLVSYNGFLLTDGSGQFSTPHSAADAAVMRDALKTCRTYLKQFLAEARDEASSSMESLATAASSSTYVEEEEYSDEDDSSDDSPAPPRRRRAKAAVALSSGPPQDPSTMKLAELKEFLRGRGVSAVGNKASLVVRAQSVLAREAAAAQRDGAEDTSATGPAPRSLSTTSSALTVRNSGASASSAMSSPASSLLVSPTSRTSTESHGLWGALVTVGSRLFSGAAHGPLGQTHRPSAETGASPPAKRRRSA